RVVEINPDLYQAHNNLGLALQELGELDSATASYRRALEIKPELAEAHNNLGNSLQELGRIEIAMESYRRALDINPDSAEAHNNLGLSLQQLGHLDGAMKSYRRALALKPDYAEALCNLGNAQLDLGQLDSAVASYLHALEVNSDLATVHNNLGVALRGQGHLEESLASYRRALRIKSDYAEAHNNLGLVLQDLGQLEDAVESYRNALKIKPVYPDAYSNLLLSLNYSTTHRPAHELEQAKQYGRLVSQQAGVRFTTWQSSTHPERLRVGVVSGDLRNHVVGFFMEGLLAHIDSARIELIAYPTQHIEDELTARIRPYFSEWKPLAGKSDAAAARRIHADAVHILIDLSGHTAHNRLPVFAWKPAPIQLSWLGYFATTGIAEIDYFLADQVGMPENHQAHFTESVWYLPDTRLCFTAPNIDLPVAFLPAFNNGYTTFGCFQNLSKLGDDVLELWARIFSDLPKAKLRIQCKQLGESSQVKKLLQRLQHYGIDPARVNARGATDRATYLAAHSEVDMILDTFPFPGGTTTCEALWMGVPTLTLAGDSLLARQGVSLLTAAGLEKWVATSKEEYIAKAITLASDLPELTSLRAGLRQQVLASPLFDAPRFARNFEDALWGMWTRHTQHGYKAE
ncbi:MAG: tetratricopeptide repeat protein, partial [Gallionella sp.]